MVRSFAKGVAPFVSVHRTCKNPSALGFWIAQGLEQDKPSRNFVETRSSSRKQLFKGFRFKITLERGPDIYLYKASILYIGVCVCVQDEKRLIDKYVCGR